MILKKFNRYSLFGYNNNFYYVSSRHLTYSNKLLDLHLMFLPYILYLLSYELMTHSIFLVHYCLSQSTEFDLQFETLFCLPFSIQNPNLLIHYLLECPNHKGVKSKSILQQKSLCVVM